MPSSSIVTVAFTAVAELEERQIDVRGRDQLDVARPTP